MLKLTVWIATLLLSASSFATDFQVGQKVAADDSGLYIITAISDSGSMELSFIGASYKMDEAPFKRFDCTEKSCGLAVQVRELNGVKLNSSFQAPDGVNTMKIREIYSNGLGLFQYSSSQGEQIVERIGDMAMAVPAYGDFQTGDIVCPSKTEMEACLRDRYFFFVQALYSNGDVQLRNKNTLQMFMSDVNQIALVKGLNFGRE